MAASEVCKVHWCPADAQASDDLTQERKVCQGRRGRCDRIQPKMFRDRMANDHPRQYLMHTILLMSCPRLLEEDLLSVASRREPSPCLHILEDTE